MVCFELFNVLILTFMFISFRSEEAFQLWLSSWASLYDDETDNCGLIYEIHDTFYLVAIIDNDFQESNIFSIFEEAIQLENEENLKASLSSVSNDSNLEI